MRCHASEILSAPDSGDLSGTLIACELTLLVGREYPGRTLVQDKPYIITGLATVSATVVAIPIRPMLVLNTLTDLTGLTAAAGALKLNPFTDRG